MFGTILISTITLLHIYVFGRAATVPLIARLMPKKILFGIGLLLWVVFFLGRIYGRQRTGLTAATLDFIGMGWMGMLFLLFAAMLTVDIATGFGFLLPRLSPSLRGWALVAGALLSVVALIQGLRPPVVRNYEVHLAGVDDLTSLHRSGSGNDPILQALKDKPAGVTVLLSHTPWLAEKAAGAGASLMLSGHTHGEQIWPFDYLVRRVYPLLAGRYPVDGMDVIVSRGTGTWGPRMRLWRPGEILRITLHAKT